MAIRIQNKFILEVLDLVSRITSNRHFFPLHIFFLCIYKFILTPLLFQMIKIKFPIVNSIVLRNSALSYKDFHFLLSDLDISVILKKSPAENEILELNNYLAKLREYLVFLGEYEIYTKSEHHQKVQIENSYALFYNWSWNMRKLFWMKNRLSLNQNKKYHRLKLIRAIKKIEKNLKPCIHISEQNEIQFSKAGVYLIHILSQYIKLPYVQPMSLNEPSAYFGFTSQEIGLTESEIPYYLAVQPRPDYRVDILRKHKSVNKFYLSILQHEMICNKNNFRLNLNKASEHVKWENILAAEIRKFSDTST